MPRVGLNEIQIESMGIAVSGELHVEANRRPGVHRYWL